MLLEEVIVEVEEGGTYGDGVGDLTDDALVGGVGVRGRHGDGLVVGVVWFECCV